MIDLSIIIVSYNTAQLTKKCIETIIASISKSDLKIEIILLDNNSSDKTIDIIVNPKKQIPNFKQLSNNQYLITNNIRLKLIKSKENLGFAKGNNQAVKQAAGKHLLFLNTDIEVLNGAIPKLYNYFINQTLFQFVGAKLFNKDMTPQPSVGPFYSLPYVFVWLFLQGDRWGGSRQSPNQITQSDWVSGACFITKKEYYDALAGFDEKIFMYMDEVDLFYRAKQKNFKIGYYPDAQFIHLGSASSSGRTTPILQVYQGLLYFYNKHYSKQSLNILIFLLKLKAVIAIAIGRIFSNNYLITTYEQAYKITKDY